MEKNNKIEQNALRQLKSHCKTLAKFDNGEFGYNKQRIKLITPLPINDIADSSKNGLELGGIGKYGFTLDKKIDVYIFPIENLKTNKLELLIVPRAHLEIRIDELNTNNGEDVFIRFWITEWGIFETFGIGVEFEFMGLWLDKKRTYTEYLNNYSFL